MRMNNLCASVKMGLKKFTCFLFMCFNVWRDKQLSCPQRIFVLYTATAQCNFTLGHLHISEWVSPHYSENTSELVTIMYRWHVLTHVEMQIYAYAEIP